ncbi:hypothetical protein CGJ38_15800, partial [Vibrio parahaemolyticus]
RQKNSNLTTHKGIAALYFYELHKKVQMLYLLRTTQKNRTLRSPRRLEWFSCGIRTNHAVKREEVT